MGGNTRYPRCWSADISGFCEHRRQQRDLDRKSCGKYGVKSLLVEPTRMNLEFADNVTKVLGLHVIKWGYQGVRLRENDTVYSQPSGVYNFSGLGTGFPFKSNTGNSFASFLLGEADNATFTTLLER